MQLPMGLAGSNLLFFLKLGVAQLPWLLGVGIAGLSAHYCLAKAFRSGDATLVVPLDFLRLPPIGHRLAVLRRSPRSLRVCRRISFDCRDFVEFAFRDEAVYPFTIGRNPITGGSRDRIPMLGLGCLVVYIGPYSSASRLRDRLEICRRG